jgi:hypothetical protein
MKQSGHNSDLSTATYSKLFPFYFTGPTGHRIRRYGGRNAQLLGLFLLGNPCATSIGLYHLPRSVIHNGLDIGAEELPPAFEALRRADFALYDYASEYVWVKEMARLRFGLLKRSDCLAKSDTKVILANRLYMRLPDVPFLWGFAQRYRSSLRLVTSRHPKVSGTNKLLSPGIPHAIPHGISDEQKISKYKHLAS